MNRPKTHGIKHSGSQTLLADWLKQQKLFQKIWHVKSSRNRSETVSSLLFQFCFLISSGPLKLKKKHYVLIQFYFSVVGWAKTSFPSVLGLTSKFGDRGEGVPQWLQQCGVGARVSFTPKKVRKYFAYKVTQSDALSGNITCLHGNARQVVLSHIAFSL